jgi:pyruvate formate lyase activating enzyme
MKGLIFDIKRFAIHDGSGIRVTVFLKGCPLSCWWCHNPESRSPEIQTMTREQKVNGKVFHVEEQIGKWMTPDEVMNQIERERVFMEESDGGVTFSGGEPLMQHEFLGEVLEICKDNFIHTALDTTGFASRAVLRSIMDKVDVFLYDIKHLDDKKHKNYAGVSNKKILDNLKYLHDNNKNIIVRFPVIPGINDDAEHIDHLNSYIKEELPGIKEVDILPYHNIAEHKYEKLKLPYLMSGNRKLDALNISSIQQKFENSGFLVKVGG